MKKQALLTLEILCVLAAIRTAHAQSPRRDITVASAQWFHAGSLLLGDSQRRIELDSHTLRLRAMVGGRIARTETILAGEASYQMTLAASRVGDETWLRDTYHFPSLRVSVLQPLRRPWGLLAYVVGGVASDMNGFDVDDLRYTIGGGASYTVSPDLKVLFGAMVTNMSDLFPVLPLLDIRYRVGRLALRVGIPNQASAWLLLHPSFEVGVALDVMNLRYSLHASDRVADRYNALNVTLGPAARVFLWRGVHLLGSGGYDVRFFKLSQEGQPTLEKLTFRGWFVSVSVGYTI